LPSKGLPKIIIFWQSYITRRCYCLYHVDCYSCMHTQENVILVLKKLLNLSFLLFKKIFFVKITLLT